VPALRRVASCRAAARGGINGRADAPIRHLPQRTVLRRERRIDQSLAGARTITAMTSLRPAEAEARARRRRDNYLFLGHAVTRQ
jgi:hypothetical protein